MQLLPKTRGQVSWSPNPLDEQAGVSEPDGRPATPGWVHAAPQSPAAAGPSSDFMPYTDNEVSTPVGLRQHGGRTFRSPSMALGAKRHLKGNRQARSDNAALQDPQALRSAWDAWFATHPLPHGHARAAASLRVKESELLRALEGHGVNILHNDLAALLAPAAQWGRILAEVHHPLGFAYLGLSPRQVRSDGGQVALLESDRQLLLRSDAIAECFLVHGAGVCGLHGFDHRGEVITRLHLTSNAAGPTSQSIALRHLLAHSFTPGQGPGGETRTAAAGGRLTRPGWCVIERQVQAPQVLADLCHLLNTTLDDAPAMQFAMESDAAILACQATPLHKAGVNAGVPQAASDCKLHLRATALRRATVCTGSDGRPFVRLHAAKGDCLRFQNGGSPQEARAWVDSLLVNQA
jgi:hypothetical protein